MFTCFLYQKNRFKRKNCPKKCLEAINVNNCHVKHFSAKASKVAISFVFTVKIEE